MLVNYFNNLRILLQVHTVISVCDDFQCRPGNSGSNIPGLVGRADPIVIAHDNQRFASDQMKPVPVVEEFFFLGIKIILSN